MNDEKLIDMMLRRIMILEEEVAVLKAKDRFNKIDDLDEHKASFESIADAEAQEV